jgi:hypothetical protein
MRVLKVGLMEGRRTSKLFYDGRNVSGFKGHAGLDVDL